MTNQITFITRDVTDVHRMLPRALMFRRGMQVAPEGTLADVLDATPGISNRHEIDSGRYAFRMDPDNTSAHAVLTSAQPITISAGGFNWETVLNPGGGNIVDTVNESLQPRGKSPQGRPSGGPRSGTILE